MALLFQTVYGHDARQNLQQASERTDLSQSAGQAANRKDPRQLAGSLSGSKFVRPHVKSVTNGGKLTITFDEPLEFPSDIVEKLNTDKETHIALQLVRYNELRPLLPPTIPQVPVDPEIAKLNIDTNSGEMVPIEIQNVEAEEEREVLHLVRYEVYSVASEYMTLRVFFDEPDTVSQNDHQIDKLYITFFMSEFKTSEGAYIPKNSHIYGILPAQMNVDDAEIYETIG